MRVQGELAHRLDALSAATGRPRAYYVREAITEHLDDLEDYYLAVEVAQKVHAGSMPTYTAEQARTMLEISDTDESAADPLSSIA